MRAPRVSLTSFHTRRWVVFVSVSFILLTSGVLALLQWPQPIDEGVAARRSFPPALQSQYDSLNRQVQAFEQTEHQSGQRVVDDSTLRQALSDVQFMAMQRRFSDARRDIAALTNQLHAWSREINTSSVAVTTPEGPMFLPILLYHEPPLNFDEQLSYLQQQGYTSIDLDQAAAALAGAATLPAKPVVITFDDGFARQWQAFETLKRHAMKATFYIINGGQGSGWCIGAGRRYHDPSQPPGGCGDAYLTWDQIRTIDRSGFITIGVHTVDHLNLAELTPEQQRFEITDSKTGIERELGHPVRHFCYPYGAYNQTTVDIVRQAGFATATTTQGGIYQDPHAPFTLMRIRDAYALP